MLANCLPTDIVGERLMLCTDDLKTLGALCEELGATVAAILGMPIKGTYNSDVMRTALAARAAVTAEAESGTSSYG